MQCGTCSQQADHMMSWLIKFSQFFSHNYCTIWISLNPLKCCVVLCILFILVTNTLGCLAILQDKCNVVSRMLADDVYSYIHILIYIYYSMNPYKSWKPTSKLKNLCMVYIKSIYVLWNSAELNGNKYVIDIIDVYFILYKIQYLVICWHLTTHAGCKCSV